jgi:2-oxoisovalerate dehydrogenase E1 component beta subunit
VLDLRTLKPLDEEAVLESARKTSKVLIVHEANRICGLGGEVAAMRLAAPDMSVPYSPPLEDAYRPAKDSILAQLRELLAY